MEEQKNNKKSSMGLGCILIRIAAVLFCLVVVSTYLMSGLFARYTAGGMGTDSARVAGFDVRLSGVTNGVTYDVSALTPGTITITLNNQSEVAVSYKIRVDASEPACGVQTTWVDPDHDSDMSDNEAIKTTKGETEFPITRCMAAGDSDTCTLAFTAVNWDKITAGETGESAKVDLPFTVYVDVVQID